MIILPQHPSEPDLSDFGQRDGPCTLEYRDFNWNHHPTYVAHSCLGCMHLRIGDYSEASCAHPTYLTAYGVAQYMGGDYQHRDKKLCHSLSCPALKARGQNRFLEQPNPDFIDRGPEYRVREDDRSKPFDEVPVHTKTAFFFCRASVLSVSSVVKKDRA